MNIIMQLNNGYIVGTRLDREISYTNCFCKFIFTAVRGMRKLDIVQLLNWWVVVSRNLQISEYIFSRCHDSQIKKDQIRNRDCFVSGV